jgi:hypothetical protein
LRDDPYQRGQRLLTHATDRIEASRPIYGLGNCH